MIVQPGETLAGYRIDRIVGVGGMGIVYSATQLSLERTVALKVLSGELAGDAQFRERFRREARLAAQLDHPNIVPVFEAGDADDVLYIAMRFVDGTTLQQKLSKGISPRQSIEILRPIASALDAAHDAGLVHRDVKPANILVSATGHPYLADFGIAKGSALTGLTRTRGFVGSTHYAAPEQIEGLESTRATDVYALAGLLFHCLTGRVPYERDTEPSLMKAHLEDPPPSFRELGFDVPVALDDALARGLAKRPEDRFPTAGALVEGFERALAALPEGTIDERLPSSPHAADAADPGGAFPRGVTASTAGSDPSRILVPAQAGLTVADPLRPHSPAPSPEAGRSIWTRPRAKLFAGVALAVGALLAALAGFAALGSDSAPGKLEAGSLTLTYDGPWERAKVEIEGLRLEDGAGLRMAAAADGELAAGRSPSGDLGVPPTLRKRWDGAVEPRLVRIGDAEAYAFRARLRSGGAQRIYTIPTKRGYFTIACEATERPERQALAACEQVAGTARLSAGAALVAGPDPELAQKLDAVMGRLATARNRRRTALNRGGAAARAKAAGALADAHRSAARAVRQSDPPLQDRARVRRLSVAATGVASAFTRLEATGRRGDRHGFDRARSSLRRADQRLRAAVSELAAGGYRLE